MMCHRWLRASSGISTVPVEIMHLFVVRFSDEGILEGDLNG